MLLEIIIREISREIADEQKKVLEKELKALGIPREKYFIYFKNKYGR